MSQIIGMGPQGPITIIRESDVAAINREDGNPAVKENGVGLGEKLSDFGAGIFGERNGVTISIDTGSITGRFNGKYVDIHRKGLFKDGYTGTFNGQEVDLDCKNKGFLGTGGFEIEGTCSGGEVDLEVSSGNIFNGFKRTITGTYDGKEVNLTKDAQGNISGTIDGKKVDIKRDFWSGSSKNITPEVAKLMPVIWLTAMR